MGLLREPKGVDLTVGPSILTTQDRKVISEVIEDYKKTGKIPAKLNRKRLGRRKKAVK